MNRRHALAGALPLALLALGVTTAGGAPAAKDTFSFSFTTAKVKSAAGWSAEAEFPEQRIIDQITIVLPAGTVVNTDNAPQCAATDEQITNAPNGVADVCPANTKIGTGKGTAYIGDGPDPATFDLGAYNTKGGLLLDEALGGKTIYWSRGKWNGRKLVTPQSLTPSLNARIVAFELDVEKAGTAKKPVFRTPATCPKKKQIKASVIAREYQKGSRTTSDTTPCSRKK